MWQHSKDCVTASTPTHQRPPPFQGTAPAIHTSTFAGLQPHSTSHHRAIFPALFRCAGRCQKSAQPKTPPATLVKPHPVASRQVAHLQLQHAPRLSPRSTTLPHTYPTGHRRHTPTTLETATPYKHTTAGRGHLFLGGQERPPKHQPGTPTHFQPNTAVLPTHWPQHIPNAYRSYHRSRNRPKTRQETNTIKVYQRARTHRSPTCFVTSAHVRTGQQKVMSPPRTRKDGNCKIKQSLSTYSTSACQPIITYITFTLCHTSATPMGSLRWASRGPLP